MPGIFVNDFLVAQWSASMQVSPGYVPSLASRNSAPFQDATAPGPGTVYADLQVDDTLKQVIGVSDWNVVLDSGNNESVATLVHQINFPAGKAGQTYYGMCLYWIDTAPGDPHLQYAEQFPTPYVVPAGGGVVVWQYDIRMRGQC